MKNIILENNKFKQMLKIVPIMRIAIMLIVAILSFGYSGIMPSVLALLFLITLFAFQIVIIYKYISSCKMVCSDVSLYSYIPAVIFFLIFVTFNLFIKRDLFYSLTISLSLSIILLPRNKAYFTTQSYIINKGKFLYSDAFISCRDILDCNNIVFNADILFEKTKVLTSVMTVYSKYNFTERVFDITNDYAVDILKEFASILNLSLKNFTFVDKNTHNEYDYHLTPQSCDGLTYAVLNNKSGYRLIVCGDFDSIINKCNGYADKNSLSDLSEDRNEIVNSLAPVDDCSQILSFAFCDLAEFDSIDSVNDMIYIGSLELENKLSDLAMGLVKDIDDGNYSAKIICNNDNVKQVVHLIDSFNLEYTSDNTDIYIHDAIFDESDAAYFDNAKIVYKNSTYSNKEKFIFLGKLKENAKKIVDNALSIENKINVLTFSVIMTFLLANALIPNNVMHPYIVVMVLCIIEIISAFAVGNGIKASKRNIINSFIVAFSALSVFFAGRFLVDVQLSKFDKESVEIARTMLVYFYILLTPLYDSLTVFSEPKKFIKNIIIILSCIVLVIALNLPFVSELISFKHLGSEAVKYILLFVVIPVLINIILTTINNRKVTKNG